MHWFRVDLVGIIHNVTFERKYNVVPIERTFNLHLIIIHVHLNYRAQINTFSFLAIMV